ncbi:hypothetical protein CLW00_105196 [Mongoliibacter ruber]|uniref:Uncharacterized protein n=1 Tax=Mongoliibacter ruber TaxID=1750599 RepID=A0A2T0WN14_9BACT|nr:hypothetical protein CLW00_105196 [Mongoliibacter ruber]
MSLLYFLFRKQIQDLGLTELYFPVVTGNTWETDSLSSSDCISSQMGKPMTLLNDNGTCVFILLIDCENSLERLLLQVMFQSFLALKFPKGTI